MPCSCSLHCYQCSCRNHPHPATATPAPPPRRVLLLLSPPPLNHGKMSPMPLPPLSPYRYCGSVHRHQGKYCYCCFQLPPPRQDLVLLEHSATRHQDCYSNTTRPDLPQDSVPPPLAHLLLLLLNCYCCHCYCSCSCSCSCCPHYRHHQRSYSRCSP